MNSEPANPHRAMGRGMALVASLLLLGGLWLYFSDAVETRDNPNRSLAVAPGTGELVLRRGSHGHYIFPGEINGRPVIFLLDTGATVVSVPAHLAGELGLTPGARQTAITANGTVATRATRIETLAFGPFVVRNVPASLNPGMGDMQILLGMSVLKHLEFTQRGDRLILRPAGG